MYTTGSCAAGYRSFFPGGRLVYALFLGDATPLGGTLTVTTCGATSNDTVLYVGTGCPTWADPFRCLAGSDNDTSCGTNTLASRVVVPAVSQTRFFIQVGGAGGVPVTSGLAWGYAPPPTPSRSRTRSRTRTRSATRSGTRKPK
jgi:hypothetical protein